MGANLYEETLITAEERVKTMRVTVNRAVVATEVYDLSLTQTEFDRIAENPQEAADFILNGNFTIEWSEVDRAYRVAGNDIDVLEIEEIE